MDYTDVTVVTSIFVWVSAVSWYEGGLMTYARSDHIYRDMVSYLSFSP